MHSQQHLALSQFNQQYPTAPYQLNQGMNIQPALLYNQLLVTLQ
jgi:hypothetical protein